MDFTKPRFLGLPLRQQHKKCAQLLRQVYDLMRDEPAARGMLDHYNTLQAWMGLALLDDLNFKRLADRYHWHLQAAQVNLRENNLLHSVRTGDREAGEPLLPIAIYLDNVRSAFNVGSIIRTAEALALGAIYCGGMTPTVENRQVQNTSMDASQWVPCHQGVALEQLPRPVVVLDTSSEATSLHDFIFPDQFTLVLGNEEYGCSDATLLQADYLIEIPLYGRKNSLNVANAFAVVAVEVQRQKKVRMRDEKQDKLA